MRVPDWMMNLLKRPWHWLRRVIAGIFMVPGPAFDFDDGTVQHFIPEPIRDDAGTPYDPPLLAHNEAADYQTGFPFGSNLNDKTGSLSVNIPDWQPYCKHVGFPATSKYWQVDVVSPLLTSSTPWQQVQTLETWLADGYSITGDHVSAALFLFVEQNGKRSMFPQVGGTVFQPISRIAWTKVTAQFKLPPGAQVRNVVIRVRGEYAQSSLDKGKLPLYEGAIAIDHVAAAA